MVSATGVTPCVGAFLDEENKASDKRIHVSFDVLHILSKSVDMDPLNFCQPRYMHSKSSSYHNISHFTLSHFISSFVCHMML